MTFGSRNEGVFNKGKLKELLRPLAVEVTPVTSSSYSRMVRMFSREGATVLFDERDHKRYEAAVSHILSVQAIHQNFPEKFIRERLDQIIARCVVRKQKSRCLAREVDKLYDEFRTSVRRRTFIVPLANLKLVGRRRLLLGGYKVYEFTAARERRFLRDVYATVDVSKPGVAKRRARIREWYERFAKEHLIGKVCVEFEIASTNKVASHLAVQRARLFVNLLRLYTYSNDDFYRRYIAVDGQENRGRSAFLSGDGSTYTIHPIDTRPLFEFELDRERISFMEAESVRFLATLMTETNHGELQRRLLSAIHWFGEAMAVPVVDTITDELATQSRGSPVLDLEYSNHGKRMLLLFTALECALLDGHAGAITRKLSERTAYILSRDLNQRYRIAKEVEGLYETRGGIAHAGHAYVERKALQSLARLTQAVILQLARLLRRGEVRTPDELRLYFERARFA